jgi:two-component system, NarL family, response regulator LiaR
MTGKVHPASVLLADDDDRFRTIVRSLLEGDGYRVVAEAANASETVEQAVRHQPDVVVVDLVMEGSDGLSTVQDLLALDSHRPVIVISSLFDPLVEIEAARLGAWYLEKVEGVEALEHAIDQAFSVTHRR